MWQVPVHRLYKIQDPTWVNAGSHFTNIKKHAPLMIESQLVFRNDAPGRFQHGEQPKGDAQAAQGGIRRGQ